MKRRNSNWGWYLILNVLVSAAVTLGVLYAWERLRADQLPEEARSILEAEQATRQAGKSPDSAQGAWQPMPTATAADPLASPPPLENVIEVGGVVGAGDLEQEYVLLRRLGEGDLDLSGWKLQDARGDTYTFQGLILFKGGAVRLYSRPGGDTATELYWSRSEAAWKPGDSVVLLDAQGNTRATYTIP